MPAVAHPEESRRPPSASETARSLGFSSWLNLHESWPLVPAPTAFYWSRLPVSRNREIVMPPSTGPAGRHRPSSTGLAGRRACTEQQTCGLRKHPRLARRAAASSTQLGVGGSIRIRVKNSTYGVRAEPLDVVWLCRQGSARILSSQKIHMRRGRGCAGHQITFSQKLASAISPLARARRMGTVTTSANVDWVGKDDGQILTILTMLPTVASALARLRHARARRRFAPSSLFFLRKKKEKRDELET